MIKMYILRTFADKRSLIDNSLAKIVQCIFVCARKITKPVSCRNILIALTVF